LQALLRLFDKVDNMEMFTGQALDAAATLALAKGALLKVQILEQLVLLGGLGANGELQAFSADMVRKLEVRRGLGARFRGMAWLSAHAGVFLVGVERRRGRDRPGCRVSPAGTRWGGVTRIFECCREAANEPGMPVQEQGGS